MKMPVMHKFDNKLTTVSRCGISCHAQGSRSTYTNSVATEQWALVTCKRCLKSRDPITGKGTLRYETWEKDNQRKSKHGITAFKVQFLGDKPESKPVLESEPEQPEPPA